MPESLERPSKREQAMPSVDKTIGKEEFCDRFVASMIVRAAHHAFADGCSVKDYAEETAMSYWESTHFRSLDPESCVVSDMRHWHGTWS